MEAFFVMAIARDYLEPTETKDAGETQFVDRLLEGWAKWARNDGIDLRPTCAGNLWQIQAIIEVSTYVLKITDDGFTLVDQKIAALPGRLKGIVFVEYTSSGSAESKARRLGLNRFAYRQRLHAAQWTLFSYLVPTIELWRQ